MSHLIVSRSLREFWAKSPCSTTRVCRCERFVLPAWLYCGAASMETASTTIRIMDPDKPPPHFEPAPDGVLAADTRG